ncbi:MAG: CYTH domain-containing protein [Flavobacteriaceae bacterium]|nr:CYTH domain-containing protein [Flavobacteriaceae bacterium]
MIEIERKFLVTSDAFKEEAFKVTQIVQGFLNKDPERTVRIRIKGEQGFLTVKGISNDSGTSRFEWEKEITVEEATSLLKLCEEGVISKNRYEVKKGNYVFEVDEFFEENEGLLLAEVELENENETYVTPEWIGKEVTGIKKYYNSQLSIKPYNKW